MSASSSPPGTANSVPSASGTRTASACAALAPKASKNPPCTQAVCSPSVQKAQVPSENANGMITKSPTLKFRTSEPMSSTTPMASWPIGLPVSVGSSAPYGHRSLPQMEARVIRTTASVGSEIEGSGTSSIRTSPASYINVPRMLSSRLLQMVLAQRSSNSAKLRGRLVPGIDRAPLPGRDSPTLRWIWTREARFETS